MILTHGGNSINSGGGGTPFIFLSYFNNINLTTGVDTPIIGSPITFDSNNYSIIKDSLSYESNLYPDLIIKNSLADPSLVTLDSLSNLDLDEFSIEFISRSTLSNYDRYQTDFIRFDLDVNGSSNSLNGFYTIRDKRYRCIAINNALSWSYNSSASSGVYQNSNHYLIAANVSYNTVSHQAVQFSKANNWIKFYINGELIATINKYYPIINTYLMVNGSANTNSLQITQLAGKIGNYTENSGGNYIVPSSPYIPNLI